MFQEKSLKELTVKRLLFHFNDIFSSNWTTFTRKLLQKLQIFASVTDVSQFNFATFVLSFSHELYFFEKME